MFWIVATRNTMRGATIYRTLCRRHRRYCQNVTQVLFPLIVQLSPNIAKYLSLPLPFALPLILRRLPCVDIGCTFCSRQRDSSSNRSYWLIDNEVSAHYREWRHCILKSVREAMIYRRFKRCRRAFTRNVSPISFFLSTNFIILLHIFCGETSQITFRHNLSANRFQLSIAPEAKRENANLDVWSLSICLPRRLPICPRITQKMQKNEHRFSSARLRASE